MSISVENKTISVPKKPKFTNRFRVFLFLFLYVTLAIPNIGLAQFSNAFFKNFTTEQGLPSDRLRQSIQDEKGFLWIASNNGLVRFDAYNFLVFQHQNSDTTSLASDNLIKIELDQQDMLWIGHYESGVDFFNSRTGKVVFNLNDKSKTNAIPDNKIAHIWNEPQKNRVWICTNKNMFVWYNKKTKKIINLTLKSSSLNQRSLPKTNTIYDIKQDLKNPSLYWLATNDGLGLFDETDHSIRYFLFNDGKSGYATNDRLRSLILKENSIYIAARGGDGLIHFNTINHKHELYPYPKDGEKNKLILVIKPKSENEIWIGSVGNSAGIFNTETKTYAFFQPNFKFKSSILDGAIYDISEDKQGNTWFTTNKGLSFYSPEYQKFRFLTYPPKTSDFAKAITFADDDQNIYIGLSDSEALPVFNKKTQQTKLIKPVNESNVRLSIQKFGKDPKGNMWFVASGDLYKFEPKKEQLEKIKVPKDLATKLFHSLIFDNDDNLFLGTRFSGLYKWNMKTNTIDSLLKERGNLVHNRFICEMLFDHQGRLWVSSERGISLIDPKNFKVIKNFGNELGLRVIYRMDIDKNGLLWVSTENDGVKIFDTKTLQFKGSLTKQMGLVSNYIQHLVVDKEDNVWIATQQGLCRYSQNDKNFTLFNTQNGLMESDLEASLNKLSDGSLVQGFDIGFALFKPKELNIDKRAGTPKIVGFSVFDEVMEVKNQVNLDVNQNFFSIQFSNLDFSNAKNIKYAYKLTGVNNDWIITTQSRGVNYNKVNFGNYVFETKAAFIGSNSWSEVSKINITIKPPFYFSTWFIITAIFTFLGLAYASYSYKISAVKEQERQKSEINKRIFITELRALRSQMNPHFLYNCINSIKFYIVKNEPEQASIYLNKFSKLIRKILNNSQYEFISLEEELQTLELYLEMEKLRFGDKMNYKIDIEPSLETTFIKVPTMLIQPFLENAIWHGLMQKSENNGLLNLNVREWKEDFLLIEVEDNGVGRKMAAELKSKSLNKNKSMGMEMTLARIQHLNEVNGLEITLETIDLLNENGDGIGTKVLIKMKAVPFND